MKWVRNSLICILLVFGGLCVWIGPKIDWKIFSSTKKSVGCAFCNPDVLKLNTFYEGKEALGLLTYKPACEGHRLVLPKRHVVRFEDLTDTEMVEIKEIIRKIDRVSQKMYGSTGYLLLEKNGREAGQEVPHVHFHYMPRSQNQSHLMFALKILLRAYFKPTPIEEMRKEAELLSDEMSYQ